MTRDQRFVLAIAILASFVTFLDGSVITVALPAISHDLGGGISVQQWVVDAYLITLGTLILLAGSLSDTFGRMLILKVGLIGFGVASLLIAFSPSADFLIALRAVQGVAGALLVPSSLALIISNFSGVAQGRAIGLWTGFTSASFLGGPVIGGLFIDYVGSWRPIFAINVIPIVATLVLIRVLRQKSDRPPGAVIDWWGAVLGIIGLGGPVFGLIEHATYGWASPAIFLPFGIGILSLVAFVLRQRTAKNPMVPLVLFRVRNFSVGNVSTAFIYGALSLGGFILTVYLQEVAGFPATLAGLATLPVSLGNIFLSSWFGTLSAKYGPRLFMGLGPILGGAGYLLMMTTGQHVNYFTQVLPGILLFTIGLSATVSPLTAAILGSIPQQRSGIGSAINNAVSRIAGLITTALVGVIVGARLTPSSFHRALFVTAALLIAGGVISLIGIQNATTAKEGSAASTDESSPVESE